ncbi:MAG: HDOD domain-containing protein [Burkholderiales bacterium]|nr:HDOD domain-containing protein [Burkholderiales bacterium]
MAAVMDAARIGRFDIVKELGRGAQGTVYLGVDSHLRRKVALKTLRLDKLDDAARAAQTELMLGEARIVGQLTHPNIVTLFDAGEDGGRPYLVFEFVEGHTLNDAIRERGTLAPAEAARIAAGFLTGVDCAHTAGVLHRDLKPANIMLTRDGTPRVMDFGIASNVESEGAEKGLRGTPSYMAPEYLSGQAFSPRGDVFAAGMVLYEMLTGSPAVKSDNFYQTMYAMVQEPFVRPSQKNESVDERLEAIVMKALEKDPAARYASAQDMMAALTDYLNPQRSAANDGGEPTRGAGGALEFLLRRMRYKSDFPVLSSTISTVNSLVAADNERTGALSDSILKDVSLTNKLLRMVNTAYYKQFGGAVSTVSRAVSILGFQKVRNAALSLMLFEHLQNKAQAADLKDHVTASYFSGVMSGDLVTQLGIKNGEEAFICSMFHRLGKLLAIFYLHEESSEIARIAKGRNIDENQAAVEVLGMSYTDLGLGVAKEWNFPEAIAASMKPAKPGAAHGASEESKMRALADISNRMSDAVALPPGKQREALIAKLETDYGKAFNLDTGKLEDLLGRAAREFSAEAKALGLGTGSGPFAQGLRALVREPEDAPPPGNGGAPTIPALAETVLATTPVSMVADPAGAGQPTTATDGATSLLGGTAGGGPVVVTTLAAKGTDAGQGMATTNVAAPPAAGTTADPAARQMMLTAGIQDITNTLAGEYQLNDVLRIILETMYRAIGFTRVMFCTRDPKTNTLKGRFGFGESADAIVKAGFQVPLGVSKDVFYAAISKSADICIEDRDSEKIRSYIPDWYRRAVSARGFVIFPVMVNKKPVALIYADGDDSSKLRFGEGELNLLKTLRNQAILAIRQKSPG